MAIDRSKQRLRQWVTVGAVVAGTILGGMAWSKAQVADVDPAIREAVEKYAPVALFAQQERHKGMTDITAWVYGGGPNFGAEMWALSKLNPEGWPRLASGLKYFLRGATPYPLEVEPGRFTISFYNSPMDVFLIAEYLGTAPKGKLNRAFLAPGEIVRGTPVVHNFPGWMASPRYTDGIISTLDSNLAGVKGVGIAGRNLFDFYLGRLVNEVADNNSISLYRVAAMTAALVDDDVPCAPLYKFAEEDFLRATSLAAKTNIKEFPQEFHALGKFMPVGGFRVDDDNFVRFYMWENSSDYLFSLAMEGQGGSCQLTSFLAYDMHGAERRALEKMAQAQ